MTELRVVRPGEEFVPAVIAPIEDKSAQTKDLTPRQIVAELDRYIVGQHDAKRAVAIAIRNRWRRQQLPDELRQEVSPKNILMIGPTGVGKTEIARRLAKLTGAPFIKVEATKYTEVGYYGRDVESIVRELVDSSLSLVRQREKAQIEDEARAAVEDRLIDMIRQASRDGRDDTEPLDISRDDLERRLAAGELEDRKVEIVVETRATPIMVGGVGMEHMDIDLQGMFEKILPKQTNRRELSVSQARKILFEQECDARLDQDKINHAAIELAENLGIIFIDELDKIVASETRGADVSRQGVQRDLLPIVEGTHVQTRYGHVRTEHILFIAAGAFHKAKPSDLMPELQGRFPIRVELKDLTKDDFVRILKEPKNSLTGQYAALMGTEGVMLDFTDDSLDALAAFAYHVNQTTQNIGARRLYTILERLLEDLSFEAPDMHMGEVKITAQYVKERLSEVAEDEDLSRYIL
jgi:ATP-dependent HslUV protease ATP-binding subunit HslU